MIDDTPEIRERLDDAWALILKRTLEAGYPREAVVESLATFAVELWADLNGAHEVANYLRLLAQQVMDREETRNNALLVGDDPVR